MRQAAIASGLVTLGIVALSGCVTAPPQDGKIPKARWTTEKYQVSFTSGPLVAESGKILSYYQVRPLGRPTEEIIIPSAQSTNGLRSVSDSNPKSHIRLIEDPANSLLLIEENVPNDCCLCVNYALIEPDPDYQPRLRYRFLKFPVKPSGNAMAMGAFGTEFPSVTSVRGDTIEYKYGNQPLEHIAISSLPTSNEPTPPG